ncbi:MAG: type II toxin-antitoxin system VapC family toxin [Blastocatellales bacterium]
MKIWFADTSALIKRYIREPGSDWLRSELIRHEMMIAHLTPIELTAALGRRYRQGIISQFAFFQARQVFVLHLNAGKYRIVDWQKPIFDEAMRLTFRQGLRAYDAVQLASALVTSASIDRNRFTFLTADAALERVAQAEGLPTDNPLNH